MTLPLNSRLSALYNTNGTQKDFSFGFRVFFDPDNGGYGLEVRRQTPDGYEVIPKSDYLVLPVEDNSAGVVRFSVAPSAGQQIYIAGKTPTIQQLVLTNFGRYSAESIETQFDFITAIIQEWLSALGEETRQRIAADEILTQYVVNRIDDFVQQINQNWDDKSQEIEDYISKIMPSFTQTLREEIEAYAVAGMQDAIDQTLAESKAEIDDAVARANAAALAAAITGKVYDTPEAGVNPVTGVQNGEYYNVRSSSDDSYIDEYQNIGGSAVATGKSYPSGSYVKTIADYTALPFKQGKGYALYERVQLDNGDVVRSSIENNLNNPNENMTGWELVDGSSQIIDLSGLSLADGTDISAMINNELQKSAERPIRLILPCGNFDLSASIQSPPTSKGVILDLNGSVLKPRSSYSNPDNYLISLYSTTDYPVAVINGTIDGINRPQNLFEVTDINALLSDATNGIFLRGINVSLKNLSIKNLYGQTTKYFARNATTEDVFIDNCGGHWYANDAYDMFGDAFYIGTGFNSTGEIFVSFKNVRAFGKYSTQYPENHQTGSPLNRTMYSRIGLTIEKFGGSFNNTVYVKFDNCDFRNFERGIHQEIEGITTYLTMLNTRFDYAVLFGAYLTDTLNSYAHNCNFNNLDSDWLTSRGVVRAYDGESIAVLENCTVSEMGVTTRGNLFGMAGTLSATNTTFNNVQYNWGENLQLKLNNCTVNVSKHASDSFLTYGGFANLKDVTVNYVGTDVDTVKTYENWSNLSMSNVTLENITPPKHIVNLSTGMQNNSLIVPDGNTQNWKGWKFNVRTKSGNILHRSSIFWGIPESTVNKQDYLGFSLPKPTTGNLNILTQKLKDYISKRGLSVIIARGFDSGSLYALESISGDRGVFANGYSVAIVAADPENVDKVRIVQPFTHIGNAEAYNLTFDTGFNVTAYGSYTTHVLICAIPYSDLETLPALPNRILNSIAMGKGVSVTNATGTDNTAVTLNSLLVSLRNAGVIQ